jgi:hypothetical protein
VRQEHYEALLSNFGKTPVTPVLYFLPAKLDDWTEQEFGIKNPKNLPAEKAEEETAKVRVVTEGEEDGDDREALIVEIKENEEAESAPSDTQVKEIEDAEVKPEEPANPERQSDSESASEEK